MVVLAGAIGLLLLAGGWVLKVFAVGALAGTTVYLIGCGVYRANRPFRSPVLGWVLKLAGVAGLVALLVADATGDADAFGAFGRIKFLPPHFGLLLVWLAFVPMHLGYKLCQGTFHARRHSDPRPPVLYLRAFTDDEFTSLQPRGWVARFHGLTPPFALFEGTGWNRRMTQSMLIPIHPIRLIKLLLNADRYYSEELFAAVFRRVGPVVAIGRPGEWFASAGSDKMYVSDAEWQQVVLDYLAECRAVILQPSKSAGVRWEVEQVLNRVPREKVLLCLSNFHGKPEDYDEFREWVRSRTGVALPADVPTLPTPALVYFDDTGTPTVQPVCYRSPLVWPFVVSGVDEPRTFGPFLRRLRGEPAGKPAAPRRHFGHRPLSVLLVIALFLTFVVGVGGGPFIWDAIRNGQLFAPPEPDHPVEYNGKGVKYAFTADSRWKPQAPPPPLPDHVPVEHELVRPGGHLFRVAATDGLLTDFDDLPRSLRETFRQELTQAGARDVTFAEGRREFERAGVRWTELTFTIRHEEGRAHCRVQVYNSPEKSVLLLAVVPDTARERGEVERIMNSFHFVPPSGGEQP